MLTIERAASGLPGYRIKIKGDRTLYIAKDSSEVLIAVQHYFGEQSHFGNLSTYCPLCRRMAGQRAKEARREARKAKHNRA